MDSDDLAQRVGRVAGLAARTGYSLGKRLPGAGTAERGFRSLEKLAFTELRRRLENVDDPFVIALGEASAGTSRDTANGQARTVAVIPAGDRPEPLRAAMAELLNRSIGFDRAHARDYLYALILRELTPDEARIVSALADGSPFPAIDVAERGGLGGSGRVVLRNASTVGKIAGVTLLDHVPAYVTRLLGLGLVDLDEETPGLDTQYEILLTDDTVRDAERLLKRPRYTRRTLRISELGARFWRACDPSVS